MSGLFIETYGGYRANPDLLPHNGTDTSKVAAERKAASGTADSDRNRIVVYLRKTPGGATRDELEVSLGINGNSLRPRLKELLGKDKAFLERGGVACLYESDEKRLTRTGTPARVLKHRANERSEA